MAPSGHQHEKVLTLHESDGSFSNEVFKMPNLQVKDIDEKLYSLLREKAQSENRSISQEVVTILEEYLANPRSFKPNPAREFLKLTGSWKDNRSAEEVIEEIRQSRTNNPRFESSDDIFA